MNATKDVTTRSRRRQRGSAMVESAMVILAALVLLIGIADVGQFLFLHASVMERMRGALRHGALDYDPVEIENLMLYGKTQPEEGDQPSFNLTAEMVEVTRIDELTSADRVMITVSNYPIDFFTPGFAGRYTGPTLLGVLPMELGNLPGED